MPIFLESVKHQTPWMVIADMNRRFLKRYVKILSQDSMLLKDKHDWCVVENDTG